MRGLEKRLGIERADAVSAVAENWAGGPQEVEPSWRVQLGGGADGGLWEAMDLLLGGMQGKAEVRWVRGHDDKRTTTTMMNKHQRGNAKANANCTAVKRGEEQGSTTQNGLRGRLRAELPPSAAFQRSHNPSAQPAGPAQPPSAAP